MRLSRVFVFILFSLAISCAVFAATNSMGIQDVSRITFVAPMRVGGALLPAGDYLVRHTMNGEEHVMVFESAKTKAVEAKATCKLVPLTQKAPQTTTVYEMNAANERVLQELVFRGDTAKHVFQ